MSTFVLACAYVCNRLDVEWTFAKAVAAVLVDGYDIMALRFM